MIRIDASKPFASTVQHWVYGGRDAHRTWHADAAMGKLLERGAREAPLWLRIELALQQPLLAMGLRGLQRDAAALCKAYVDGIEATRPIIEEANELVCEVFPQWRVRPRAADELPFSLASGHQLRQVLHNKPHVAPCPECGDTGVVVTQPDAEVELWECTCNKALYPAPGECPVCHYLQLRPAYFRSGPRKGERKTRTRALRTRACRSKHVMPGFGMKPYRNRDTGQPMVSRQKLGQALQRELGTSPTVGAQYTAHAVQLLRLALRFSELLKVPQECLAPGRGAGLHAPADPLRMPFQYNIGLPVTHRLSCESTPYGEGRNAQNLDRRTRKAQVYIARAGAFGGSADQSKAESHLLAAFAEDARYLEAHEGPCDTHAMVAHWIWPELDWPADPRAWKDYAEKFPFTRAANLPYSVPYDSIRQASKKTQHTVGRGGGGDQVAEDLGAARAFGHSLIEMFLERVPATMRFIDNLRNRLANSEIVHVGVRVPPEVWLPDSVRGPAVVVHVGPGVYWWRPLLTDPRSKDTFKDALAFVLQSPSALITELGLLRLWNTVDNRALLPGGSFQLIMQKHDALGGEYERADGLDLLRRSMEIELVICGRPLRIGVASEPGKLV